MTWSDRTCTAGKAEASRTVATRVHTCQVQRGSVREGSTDGSMWVDHGEKNEELACTESFTTKQRLRSIANEWYMVRAANGTVLKARSIYFSQRTCG